MEGAAAENMPDEASDVEMEEPEELTAEKSINPIFSTAGGTLINQGTLMTKLSLRHKFLYRNSGFHPKILSILS